MAHPYAKYSADKVGRDRAQKYQSGGKVREAERLGGPGREAQRRENYARGADKLGEGMFGIRMQAGSPLHDMAKYGSMIRSYDIDRAVPRRKED